MAEEIGDQHLIRMRPLKWKCTNECQLLTSGSFGDKVAISKKHGGSQSWP